MDSLKMEKDLDEMKKWIIKQIHLPQNIDDQVIRRFILSCNSNLEKTKQVLELNYNIRTQTPEIFDNRDILDSKLQEIIKLGDFLPLPKTTNNNCKLILFRVTDKNCENFLFNDVLKILFMVSDVRFVSEIDIADGEIPIFDMAGLTLQHLSKVTLSSVRKYMLYTQEAHPVRLRGIHVINTPTFVDRVMLLVKPFMKGEVANMLHFHTNMESFAKYIPRELLPNEYGGQVGPISEIKEEWLDKIYKHRQYLMDDTRWKLNETKHSNNNNKAVCGMQGSFRSLTID